MSGPGISFAAVAALLLVAGCSTSMEVGDPEPAHDQAGNGGFSGEGSAPGDGSFSGDGNTPPSTCDLSRGFAPARPDANLGGAGAGSEPRCGCTRRPGAGTSFRCPAGTGRSVVAEVGPDGGTVALGGTPSTQGVSVELRIPPNALDRTVAIRITETTIPPIDELADWSPIYHFEPETLRFNVVAEVRIPWSNSASEFGPEFALYWSDDAGSCTLTPLDDNYQNAGFNQGSVRGLGWAIVGGARAGECY